MNSDQASPAAAIAAGTVAVVLPAAGKSQRFRGAGLKKIFALLQGRPVWWHSANMLRQRPEVGQIILVTAKDDQELWHAQSDELERLRVHCCIGGEERSDSVRCGLEQVSDHPLVAIHDAARPIVPDSDLRAVFQAGLESGAALLATPVRGTLKRLSGDQQTCSTIDREGVWEALTPQVFRTEILQNAYHRWRGRPVTDDAQLVERAGYPVRIVAGSPHNLKITQADDLLLATALLATRSHPAGP